MTSAQDVMRVELERVTQYNRTLMENLNEARRELAAKQNGEPSSPATAARYAVFLGRFPDGALDISADGRRLRTRVQPGLDPASLRRGDTILLDETYAVVATVGRAGTGEVMPLQRVLPDARRAIVGVTGEVSIVYLAEALADGPLHPGDLLLVDRGARYALERLGGSPVDDLLSPLPKGGPAQLIGLVDHLARLRTEVVRPLLRRSPGAVAATGVLLHGPSGCGKSALAVALASLLTDGGGHAFQLHAADLHQPYIGETERLLGLVFDRVHQVADTGQPGVLVIEDVDALLRVRGRGTGDSLGAALVPRFLMLLDRAVEHGDVVVVGVTSRPDLLDPAALRPGRFDIKVHVGRPGREDARALLAARLPALAEHILEPVLDLLYTDQMPLYHVHSADGEAHPVYFSSVATAAVVNAVASRATGAAVREQVAGGPPVRVTSDHLCAAARTELMSLRHFRQLFQPDEWAGRA